REVAFVGYLRAGKSTLVNALLRRPLLPARRDTTTFVPTRVEYKPDGFASRLVFMSAEALEDERRELLEAVRGGRVRAQLGEFAGALASIGALTDLAPGAGAPDEVMATLDTAARSGAALPATLPAVERLLGRAIERAHLSETDMMGSVLSIIAPEADLVGDLALGHLERAVLAEVVLSGPFEPLKALAGPSISSTQLSLLDTPGLGDDRPHLRRRVLQV